MDYLKMTKIAKIVEIASASIGLIFGIVALVQFSESYFIKSVAPYDVLTSICLAIMLLAAVCALVFTIKSGLKKAGTVVGCVFSCIAFLTSIGLCINSSSSFINSLVSGKDDTHNLIMMIIGYTIIIIIMSLVGLLSKPKYQTTSELNYPNMAYGQSAYPAYPQYANQQFNPNQAYPQNANQQFTPNQAYPQNANQQFTPNQAYPQNDNSQNPAGGFYQNNSKM